VTLSVKDSRDRQVYRSNFFIKKLKVKRLCRASMETTSNDDGDDDDDDDADACVSIHLFDNHQVYCVD